jgi:hypothetical protein
MGTKMNLPSFLRLMQERGYKSAGAIRASIGVATNFADVPEVKAAWHFVPSSGTMGQLGAAE